MTHTPGPWRVLDGIVLCENVNQYGNFVVASIDREMTEEDKANARLIAAAPELLEALKIARKYVSSIVEKKDWVIISEAIDKATENKKEP